MIDKALTSVLFFYQPRVYRAVFAAVALLSLISCTDSGGSDSDRSDSGIEVSADERISTATLDQANNRIVVTFDLKEGDNAFQSLASVDYGQIRLISLTDPFDIVLFDANDSADDHFTEADEAQNSPNTFNYPLPGKKKISH